MRFFSVFLFVPLFSGCGSLAGNPLIFGQTITFGVSAGPSAEVPAAPHVVVGFEQDNVAVVPTIVPADAMTDENGNQSLRVPVGEDRRIAAFGAKKNGESEAEQDALSTFGSFSSNSSAGRSETQVNKSGVELGVFFSTGIAAQKLAEGFKCSLASKGNTNACTTND